MFDKGFFGGLFDFNGDGKLDGFERAADFAAFHHMMSESEKEEKIESASSVFGTAGETMVDELEAAGIQEGDTVRMYGLQFDYYK